MVRFTGRTEHSEMLAAPLARTTRSKPAGAGIRPRPSTPGMKGGMLRLMPYWVTVRRGRESPPDKMRGPTPSSGPVLSH